MDESGKNLVENFENNLNGTNENDKEIPTKSESIDRVNDTLATGTINADESVVIEMDAIDGKLKTTPITNRQANTYAAKKTVAQGMMDIALITANANQLRYIVEYTSTTRTYYINLVLISLSLMLQVAVGVTLIFKGRLDLRGESKMAHARKMNNFVVVGVFLVTIINVFIASFTITGNNNQPINNSN